MNKIITMDDIIPLIKEKLDLDGKVTFTPKGTSMLPTIVGEKDTITLVKPDFPLDRYAIPLYKRDDGGYVLHRVIKIKDGRYNMRGDNQYEIEKGIREDQIIGVVKTYNHNGEELNAFGPENVKYAKKLCRKVHIKKVYFKCRSFLGRIKRKIVGAK